MSLIVMDTNIKDNEKDLEVIRLKELVKQLESQNKELRSERQEILTQANHNNEVKSQKHKEKAIEILNHDNLAQSNIDQTDHLVEELENFDDDDENWLVKSPKVRSENKDWLKKDVDDPSLHFIKRSLITKLDEITNSPQISPKHSIYSPPSSSSIASPESPPSRGGGHFDSRTFIRTKKRQSLLETKQTFQENLIGRNREGSQLTGYQALRSRDYLGQSSGSLASEEDDRLSSASDGSYTSYRLADVEDVNTVARMQEESLKLPEPKPLNRLAGVRTGYGMSGRIPGPKTTTSDGSAGSSQEDLIGNTRKITPRSVIQPPRRYYSNVPTSTSRESSDLSSPTDSPYNSQQSLESYNARRYGTSEHRLADRVSPNFSKGPQPPARTSRLPANQQHRTSRLSVPSPVRIPGGPPQLTELPRLEVGRDRQPLIQKTRLKTPQKILPNSYKDNDWREGCY